MTTSRVGWCPGALRPMRSGDGLLVRVKPHCATLSFDQAEGLAFLAKRCGNGQIDLTSRANLQIRGVAETRLEELQAALDRLGLLDFDADVEAVRNVVASPLAGLDPIAKADIRPIVAALDDRLASDSACRRLPPKWSMVVDDGGSLSLDDMAADLRIAAVEGGRLLVNIGDAWASVAAAHLPAVLSDLAAFVAIRGPERMGELIRAVGGRRILAEAGLSETEERPRARNAVSRSDLLGRQADGLFVGVAPPFGSFSADALSSLVDAARLRGARDLRLTPWRTLLVTFPSVIARRWSRRGDPCSVGDQDRRASLAMEQHCTSDNADQLARDLTATEWIVDGADHRLPIAACVGAPGCHRATVATRPDAARLAGVVGPGPGVQVHVSGCAKGCARPAATPWTLVGREGRYDLVRGGRAGDAPVARGLSFNEAAAWVSGSVRADAPLGSR